MDLTPIERIRQYGHLCASDEDAKDFFNIADELEKEKEALKKFEGNDPIPILRLCAKTLENSNKWSSARAKQVASEIRLERANWLRRFATHLKKLQK